MDLKFKDNSQLKLAPFTQLEYIESTGTQYIDTGVIPQIGDDIEITYMIVANVGSFNTVFGTRAGYVNNACWFGYGGSFSYLELGNTDLATFNKGYSKHVKYKMRLSNDGVYLDENKVSSSVINQNSLYSLCLFGGNQNGSVYEKSSVRFFEVKLARSNTLIRNFIPVKDSAGVVCLYDSVSRTFFYNKGTGDFVAGPVVNPGIPETILLKITTLYHKNTPNIDGLQLLNGVLNDQEIADDVVLNRIRVDIGNVSGSLSELLQYAFLKGFNDNYEPQVKPRLVGTWIINDWYNTAQLSQAQVGFDGLTIVGEPNISYDSVDEHEIHILSTSVPSIAPVFITSDITKIYIGSGSSSSDDNTLMSAFYSDSKWSSYSSLLDTWYNYLHPTT